MDDAELVRRAREGDKEAFAALLARHRGMLVALCRRALGDDGLAEDAAQEAALEAMLGLDRLRRPERFGAWLAGIGLNVCRRWRREQAREGWSLAALTGGRSVPDGTPAEDVEDKRQLITEQLEKLSARIRYLVPAIATLYTAIGMLVASSISVGVGAVLGWKTAWLPVVLGLCGAAALFYASMLLVREARLAAGSTLNEMNYVRKLVARRSVAWDMKGPL